MRKLHHLFLLLFCCLLATASMAQNENANNGDNSQASTVAADSSTTTITGLYMTDTSALYIVDSAELTVVGDIIITDNSTLVNDGTIIFTGDWVFEDGCAYNSCPPTNGVQSGGTVVFAGWWQYVFGSMTGFNAFFNFILNLLYGLLYGDSGRAGDDSVQSPRVIIMEQVEVRNELVLSNGVLQTGEAPGAAKIQLSSDSPKSLVVSNSTSLPTYVEGTLERQMRAGEAYRFPMGAGDSSGNLRATADEDLRLSVSFSRDADQAALQQMIANIEGVGEDQVRGLERRWELSADRNSTVDVEWDAALSAQERQIAVLNGQNLRDASQSSTDLVLEGEAQALKVAIISQATEAGVFNPAPGVETDFIGSNIIRGEHLQLQVQNPEAGKVSLQVVDVSGRIVAAHSLLVSADEINVVRMYIGPQATGIYYLVATNGQTRQSTPFRIE